MIASRPMRTPSVTTTCAPSQTFSPTSMPRAFRALVEHRDVDAIEEMIAAHQIRVGRDQRSRPDLHRAAEKISDVEPEVRVLVKHDVAVLAAQDRVRPRNTPVPM